MSTSSASHLSESRQVLGAQLDHLYSTYDYSSRVAEDPVEFVHRTKEPADREIVALLASCLAYGRAPLFKAKIRWLLAYMDEYGGPRACVEKFNKNNHIDGMVSFRYRFTTGAHLLRLFESLRWMLKEFGSLEGAFASAFSTEHPHIGIALKAFVKRIYGDEAGLNRGFRFLVPDPALGSACKRLNLFLRWMVRRHPGVDLGQWRSIPASHLILPLDTHTSRLAYNLGLTDRREASWRNAVRITEQLRLMDPRDPTKYDFALCHVGMSGNCPSKRDDARCRNCTLELDCRWRRGIAPSARA